MQINPNPANGQTNITFGTDRSCEAALSLFDLSGNLITSKSMFVYAGRHDFILTGIKQGMYLVRISGDAFHHTGKLISTVDAGNCPEFAYAGTRAMSAGGGFKSISDIIEMPYVDGEVLLFTGTAGQYSSVVTDIPMGNKTIEFPFYLCKDSGGNTYATVQIGSEKKVVQVWMAENLNVGVRIDGVADQADNSIIEKYCSADLEANCDIYGGLYQWNEMVQYVDTIPGIQGICPDGWHLPTEEEWCILTQFLDTTVVCNVIGMIGTDIGGKMKETGTLHWNSPNTGATNISGFTVLPGGYRSSQQGNFGQFLLGADFWQSTGASATQATDRYFYYNKSNISRTLNSKMDGYSVRCIRN